MKRHPRALFGRFKFWQQLVLTLVVGFLLLAFVTSLSIAVINNKSVKTQIVDQASYLTELIARQSRLALLYQSATSAEETAEVALQFPDVVGITIANELGQVLYHEGMVIDISEWKQMASGTLHHYETDTHLVFLSPVVTEPLDGSAWGMEGTELGETATAEQIGTVTLVYAKDTLQAIQTDILVSNMGISLLMALLLLVLVIYLTRRITVPLQELSVMMNRARGGEVQLRTNPRGPQDIASMQHAFNTMLAAIELRDQELRSARDLALQSAEMKSRFAANVSHELRTPMNSVLGLLDLLTYMGLSGKQLEYVETARQSATSLLDLIDDILSYVHADSGEIVIEEGDTDLAVMVEEVVNLLAPQAQRKKVELGYVIASGLSSARLDAQRVRQILTNLVGNAIKFTERGEVAITLELLESPSGDKDTLVFRVRDTGLGIKSENLQRIFEVFTQEDSTTTRKYGGTGLGLAICRQYALLLGGDISVRSERFAGSEFSFTLPYKAADSATPLRSDPAVERARVLVVGDSTVVRDFIEQWVTDRGGEVDCATDVGSLQALLNQSDFQGGTYTHIFLDEQQHDTMLGELVKQLREHPVTSQAVISILVNPWIMESHEGTQQCFFIEKPLTDLKLSNLLISENVHGFKPRRQSISRVFADDLGKKVLVVDDNRANRLVASGMLEQFGCDCDFAQNGQEALERLSHKPFDLVLMDCNMPVMDGYQASRAIRDLPGIFDDLPIIAMTANSSPEEVRRCKDAGMNDLLVKPLTVEALGTLLQRYFSTQSSGVVRHKTPDTFDLTTLQQLQGAVGEVFASVINAFIEDLPSYLASLRTAIANNDSQQVYELAHTVKGSAASVGAQVVAGLSQTLEEMGKNRDLRGAEALFSGLEMAATKVSSDLRDYLRDLGDEVTGLEAGEQAVVLVADDDRAMRLLFANALQGAGFRILEASNGQSVVALCTRTMPDIILLDAIMPELDGFETCRKIRQLPDGAEVPILMVTSLEDERSISRAFAAGATDFVTKPVNFSVLRQRVTRLLQSSRVEHHVRKLAYSDALTGLPNRAAFSQQLRHKINRASLNGSQLAVLFLDLDRFKMINDSLGHDAGDLVLKAAAERIKRCVRDDDFVARLGGDEFTVVMEDLPDREAISRLSERIGAALREPFVFLRQRMFVTASIGIAVFPDDGHNMSTLLKHADTAMFKAKERGVDYSFYEAEMEVEITARLETERGLRTSLEQGGILFHYQPQVELASGDIVAFESLVRWQHPTRGLLPAADFIEVAEESGLSKEFGRLALAEGCELLQQWYDQGIELRLALNTSGEEFQQGEVSRSIAEHLAHYAFDPIMLEVEITESMLMAHPERAASEMKQLRAQGLTIAIDDFGSGFSSLNYLKRFSVDVLKIDRSFVADCHFDVKDQAIISGIITLAKSLNLLVVAEGVELAEQAEFLRSAGCDIAQGYYFGKPISREEVLAGIDSGALQIRRAATEGSTNTEH
ncbi:MAG: EAL domain-containing protein [Porticoccaceae bacterium]|nr:EAL domain-containing protein [Porticoccaceae bacterium]